MDLDSLNVWKHEKNTRYFLSKVRDEMRRAGQELSEGILLSHETNEKIAREYAGVIGYIEGLKYLNNFIEEESNDRSDSVLGSDGN